MIFKKKQFILTLLFLTLIVNAIPFLVFAEFVPYDIPVDQREILDSQQYTDDEVNKTFIEYYYVGQVVEETEKSKIINSYSRYEGNGKIVYPSTTYLFINNDYHYIEQATTTIAEFNSLTFIPFYKLPFVSVVNAQETVYTDYDGRMYTNADTHAQARDATNPTNHSSALTTAHTGYRSRTSSLYYSVSKQYWVFDLYTEDCEIESASLNIMGSAMTCDFDSTMGVTEATFSDPTNVVDADVDNFEDTLLSESIQCSNLDIESYNEFEYNNDGLTLLNSDVGTYHQVWGRHNYDITDSDPGISGDRVDFMYFYQTDETGTNKDPYLYYECEEEATSTPPVSTTTYAVYGYDFSPTYASAEINQYFILTLFFAVALGIFLSIFFNIIKN